MKIKYLLYAGTGIVLAQEQHVCLLHAFTLVAIYLNLFLVSTAIFAPSKPSAMYFKLKKYRIMDQRDPQPFRLAAEFNSVGIHNQTKVHWQIH